MKKFFNFRIICLLTLILMFSMSVSVFAIPDDNENYEDRISSALVKIAEYEKNISTPYACDYIFNTEFLKNAEDETSVRLLTAFSRFGFTDNYDSYGAVLKDIVVRKYRASDKLSSSSVAPWHTLSIGLMACGINPQEIIDPDTENVIDLIKDGVWAREKSKPIEKGGFSSLASGLLVIDAYNTLIPNDANITYSRDELIKLIMSYQNDDGSFIGESAMTKPHTAAFAATALAPYKNLETVYEYTTLKSKVKKSQTTGSTLNNIMSYLSRYQSKDGGYSTFENNNVKITSSVIIALCSAGIDPTEDERFIKNENTVIDALFKLQNSDGSFSDNTDAERIREDTSYAALALCAYHRFINEQTPVYDFTDVSFAKKPKTMLCANLKGASDYYSFMNVFVSTDNYEEIVILNEKARNSYLTPENEIYCKKLEEAENNIYKLDQKILELESRGNALASRHMVLGSKTTHEISVFMKEYQTLNENEKDRIKDVYDAVVEKKGSFKSKTLASYILLLFMGLLIISGVAFLIFVLVRSTPLYDYIMMRFYHIPNMNENEEEDFDEDGFELFATTDETPLPYEQYIGYDDDDYDEDDDDYY